MILVTVGTSNQPFDRLLESIAPLANAEEVIVQHGASVIRPPGTECVAFLGYDALFEHMRQARAIVMHAGVGSIIAARLAGKRPFVVPRLREHGEAVDDHQLELAGKLDEAGLVCLVSDLTMLSSALAETTVPPDTSGRESPLVGELREYLLERITPSKRASGAVQTESGSGR